MEILEHSHNGDFFFLPSRGEQQEEWKEIMDKKRIKKLGRAATGGRRKMSLKLRWPDDKMGQFEPTRRIKDLFRKVSSTTVLYT